MNGTAMCVRWYFLLSRVRSEVFDGGAVVQIRQSAMTRSVRAEPLKVLSQAPLMQQSAIGCVTDVLAELSALGGSGQPPANRLIHQHPSGTYSRVSHPHFQPSLLTLSAHFSVYVRLLR